MSTHSAEIAKGERFNFGENWNSFLSVLDERRINEAVQSLQHMLQIDSLAGRSFLDIGSGSGLFSLAARRLGARVHSFDYDPQSVACTNELKRRYFPDDPEWKVEEGSALDQDYLRSLGRFDVVYSWGVLHHTGQMWQALENALMPLAPGGLLFIAIYNDMGSRSRMWHAIKRVYNHLPRPLKLPFVLAILIPGQSKAAATAVVKGRFRQYARSWTRHGQERGMSTFHDFLDWIGGYPYEYATAEALIEFFEARGLRAQNLKRCDYKLGCNELVFRLP